MFKFCIVFWLIGKWGLNHYFCGFPIGLYTICNKSMCFCHITVRLLWFYNKNMVLTVIYVHPIIHEWLLDTTQLLQQLKLYSILESKTTQRLRLVETNHGLLKAGSFTDVNHHYVWVECTNLKLEIDECVYFWECIQEVMGKEVKPTHHSIP